METTSGVEWLIRIIGWPHRLQNLESDQSDVSDRVRTTLPAGTFHSSGRWSGNRGRATSQLLSTYIEWSQSRAAFSDVYFCLGQGLPMDSSRPPRQQMTFHYCSQVATPPTLCCLPHTHTHQHNSTTAQGHNSTTQVHHVCH